MASDKVGVGSGDLRQAAEVFYFQRAYCGT
jgi:hypothetical protein